jgi:enoyl-CoA hydratase/long-chain 3-hydroxyacyl-CoA dehydrogenase
MAVRSVVRATRNSSSIPIRQQPFSVTTSAERGKYFGPLTIDNGVAVIRLDGPEKMNTLGDGIMKEAEEMWAKHIENDSNIKAAVFISSKPDNFIAGADIQMIKKFEDKTKLKDLCMTGHDFFDRLKKKNIPLVAAIHGACLGGGLEWALKCDYRIATTDKKTKLGLPEVMLGLLPGWGGTQNLPALVGYKEAVPMILMGKEVRPDKAKKIGLVDLVVDQYALESVAVDHARKLADGSLKKTKKKKSWERWFLEDTPIGKNMFWKEVDKGLKKTGGHYPAPYAIKDCIQMSQSGKSKRECLEYEADRFVEMAQTTVSPALIGLFDGMNSVKKNRFGKADHETKTIAVLGAGLMGAGIAQVSAEKGYKVLLKDRDSASIAGPFGEKYLNDNWDAKVKKKKMTAHARNIADSNIVPLTDEENSSWQRHFNQADMVIEAVPENLELKHKVMSVIEPNLPDHCVFASNTSAIPIRDIASKSLRPENVIGMHYFSPVPSMKLLEIIRHDGTSQSTAAAAVEVGLKQGKLPIVVKDVPGFYVNRCLGPFLMETTALIADGVGLEELDKMVTAHGMPVGPITLADEVGIDVANHVREFLANADMGVRMTGGGKEGVNPLRDLVEQGMLGKKTEKGFFTYTKDKKGRLKKSGVNPEVASRVAEYQIQDLKLEKQVILDRLLSRFVNEAVLCLQEGIIENPADGDIGAVFGFGFLPYTGGPFRMIDAVGADKYCGMMMDFSAKYGPQFEPCDLLKDMAKNGSKFHK